MAHSVWTGIVSFGLVSIPVRMTVATRSQNISFHMLHDKCLNRIEEKRWCPNCEVEVDYKHVVKGMEYEKGDYVVIDKTDFESLPLPTKSVLAVDSFVDIAEIDPIYFESSYFLEPDAKGATPYALLYSVLKKKNLVAIGKVAIRTRERLCAIRCYENALMVETLWFPEEIMESEVGSHKAPEKQQMQIAEKLVDMLTEPFEPQKYHNEYKEALEQLIEAKAGGKKPSTGGTKKSSGKVVDLLKALKDSVEKAEKKPRPKKTKTASRARSKRTGSTTRARKKAS